MFFVKFVRWKWYPVDQSFVFNLNALNEWETSNEWELIKSTSVSLWGSISCIVLSIDGFMKYYLNWWCFPIKSPHKYIIIAETDTLVTSLSKHFIYSFQPNFLNFLMYWSHALLNDHYHKIQYTGKQWKSLEKITCSFSKFFEN